MSAPVNHLPPIHPGEVLADELETLGLSVRAFAAEIAVPPNRIAAILRGRRAITADTALRLSHYLGTSAKFWLNLQQSYDLRVTELERGEAIKAEVKGRTA